MDKSVAIFWQRSSTAANIKYRKQETSHLVQEKQSKSLKRQTLIGGRERMSVVRLVSFRQTMSRRSVAAALPIRRLPLGAWSRPFPAPRRRTIPWLPRRRSLLFRVASSKNSHPRKTSLANTAALCVVPKIVMCALLLLKHGYAQMAQSAAGGVGFGAGVQFVNLIPAIC